MRPRRVRMSKAYSGFEREIVYFRMGEYGRSFCDWILGQYLD